MFITNKEKTIPSYVAKMHIPVSLAMEIPKLTKNGDKYIKPSDLFGLERGKEGQRTKHNPQFPIPSQHSIEEARQRQEKKERFRQAK